MNDNKSSKSKLDAAKTTKINFDENCFACFECSTIQYIQHLQQNDKQQVRHLQQTEQQSQNLQQHIQHSQHHCNDHLQRCVIHNNSCTHTLIATETYSPTNYYSMLFFYPNFHHSCPKYTLIGAIHKENRLKQGTI